MMGKVLSGIGQSRYSGSVLFTFSARLNKVQEELLHYLRHRR